MNNDNTLYKLIHFWHPLSYTRWNYGLVIDEFGISVVMSYYLFDDKAFEMYPYDVPLEDMGSLTRFQNRFTRQGACDFIESMNNVEN